MDVILLERIGRTGHIGDTVTVKDGYARNFLLPQGKALRATEANKKKFELQRADIEARNADTRAKAEAVGEKLAGAMFTMIRQASESGQLYGSVSARDIAEAAAAEGHAVVRNQVVLNTPIKTIGTTKVMIALHGEVEVEVTVNVARTPEEAERQAKGEDVIAAALDEDRAVAEAQAKEIFEGSLANDSGSMRGED